MAWVSCSISDPGELFWADITDSLNLLVTGHSSYSWRTCQAWGLRSVCVQAFAILPHSTTPSERMLLRSGTKAESGGQGRPGHTRLLLGRGWVLEQVHQSNWLVESNDRSLCGAHVNFLKGLCF